MAKRPEDSIADMVSNFSKTTGKSLEEWSEILRASGLEKHGEMVSLLKTQHGLTHGYANMICLKFREAGSSSQTSEGSPTDELYSGSKAALRPIHESLMAKINAFGEDIDIAPKKGYLSVRRKKQFAIVQPSTATRIDLGINLKGTPPLGRLEASGSFNAMVSHRVKITSLNDVNDELIGWLKEAYEAA